MNTSSFSEVRRDRGFTLIEIMVVVIILGILVSLIAPNIFGVLDDAEMTATKVQIRNLEVALDTYRMNHSRYPSSDEGLEILLNPPGRTRGYIDVIPKDFFSTVRLVSMVTLISTRLVGMVRKVVKIRTLTSSTGTPSNSCGKPADRALHRLSAHTDRQQIRFAQSWVFAPGVDAGHGRDRDSGGDIYTFLRCI